MCVMNTCPLVIVRQHRRPRLRELSEDLPPGSGATLCPGPGRLATLVTTAAVNLLHSYATAMPATTACADKGYGNHSPGSPQAPEATMPEASTWRHSRPPVQ